MDKASGPVLLIRTKLYPPSLPEDYVVRRRLTTALDHGRHVPLTIVSAPAGYGKSVLASEWVSTLERRPAWLSLDNAESNLRQFVSYLCAALDDLVPHAMTSVRDLLNAAEPVPTPVMAASLINDLDSVGEPVLIVLDDFHRLDTDSPVTELLSLLLEHPPPNMHLFMLTRRDPPLTLGRLRASNRLVEIRLRDLRFDRNETAQWMRAAVGAPLSEPAIRHLDEELEGWPVGLRLVALMLSRAQDPEAAVAGLRGGIPQSQDYMLREVLAGLPPETRSCLLKTSILDRLTADLVQTVCQEDGSSQSGMDGGAFLRELRKANLFAYSVDSQERWYRYHHWFQQVLGTQLHARFAASAVRDLHLRAGHWFEANGEPGDALTHFLAADEPDLAAELVARRTMELIETDQWFVVDRWLKRLPEKQQSQRADLQLANAWVGYCKLDIAAVAVAVARADELLAGVPGRPEWTNELHFLHGWLDYWSEDLESARRHLERGADGFSLDPGAIAGELRLYLAFAICRTGDYPGAIRFLAEERVAAGASAGTPFFEHIFAAIAHVHYCSGDIGASEAAIERARAFSRGNSSNYALAWLDYFNALQCFSRFDLEKALEHFAGCEQHVNVLERRTAVDVLGAASLAHQMLGQFDSAAEGHEKLDRFVRAFNVADCVWIVESVAAQLRLLSGDFERALNWARAVALPEASPLAIHLWATNPNVTQARVLVMAGEAADVQRGLSLLNGLLVPYREHHNRCQLFDVEILRAVALARLGNEDQAREALLDVVRAAEPGGWIRPFIEGGDAVLELLRQLDPDRESSFMVCLRRTFEAPRVASSARRSGTAGQETARPLPASSPALDTRIMDLTDREMDILEFLDQRLQNKEIATRLFISPHTVGYHLKHIYEKLGVHGRRQAVRKARSAGILPLR